MKRGRAARSTKIGMQALREAQLQAAHAALRITRRQIVRCHEALQLCVGIPASGLEGAPLEALAKRLRLRVKRRIFEEERETLQPMETEARKAALWERYGRVEAHYQALCGRL